MKVYFKPSKKWWQFWIRKKQKELIEGKHYIIEDEEITFNKKYIGEFELIYNKIYL